MYLFVTVALAAEQVVVRAGDSVESIAARLGDPGLAAAIRAANGLGDDGDPIVGSILTLPPRAGALSTGGVLLAAYGAGSITLPGGASLPFAAGAGLPDGSVVCTEVDSFATVRLAVAQVGGFHDDVNLLGTTCVAVQSTTQMGAARSSVIEVQRGSIAVREAASAGDGTVTVKTSFGTSSGLGGGFRVHVEEGASRTEALYHPVVVFGGGEERPLAAGEGSRVRAGEVPSAPVKLKVAGLPDSPDDGAALRVPTFTWGGVAEALGYRIELSSAPDFSELVLVQDVPDAGYRPDRLLLPFRVPGLWWRVATYDRLGFLGIPSEERGLTFPAGVGP